MTDALLSVAVLLEAIAMLIMWWRIIRLERRP